MLRLLAFTPCCAFAAGTRSGRRCRHTTASRQQLVANLGRASRHIDVWARVQGGFEEPIRSILADGAADGTLRELPDVELAAAAVLGAVLHIGIRSLVVHGRIDVDEVMRLIEPLFSEGIASPPVSGVPVGGPAGKRGRSRARPLSTYRTVLRRQLPAR